MAYAILSNGTAGTGARYSLAEVTLTETAMRGYEWEARLVDDGTSWLDIKPSDGLWITLYDDAGVSMSSPKLAALQVSQDASGNVTLSGMDATTWRLSSELNPDLSSDLYRSDHTMLLSAACSAICSAVGVTAVNNSVSGNMYGIGTVSGTALSVLERVLGLFNYEWIVDSANRLQIYPLLWQSSAIVQTKTLPSLTARRVRDFEQRKTSMTFSKFLSLDAASAGLVVTVENEALQAIANAYTVASGSTTRTLTPNGQHTATSYCGSASLGGEFVKIKVKNWFAGPEWNLELYNGWPGTYDDKLEQGCTSEGTLVREGDHITATPGKPITHARFCKTFGYHDAQTTGGATKTGREYPLTGGMQAVLHCYTADDDDENQPETFTYEYETGKTPANPDSNVVSDTLWIDQEQCISKAAGQMWANNRSSHCVEYTGPWVLGIRVRDCITHAVFPTARVDQVTYSLSGGNATVSVQGAVLGNAQW